MTERTSGQRDRTSGHRDRTSDRDRTPSDRDHRMQTAPVDAAPELLDPIDPEREAG